MPRDLLAERDQQQQDQTAPPSQHPDSSEQILTGSFKIDRHPSADLPGTDTEASREQQEDHQASQQAQDARIEAIKHLHPYAAILGLSDVESCLALEDATFPEQHRATREKIQYRLNTCGELCLGLFAPGDTDDEISKAVTAKTANTTDSSTPSRKGVLLAHVIATKTRNELVSDDDMKIPASANSGVSEGAAIGHQEDGRTIAIHSLAVLPDYQKKGLGTILMKDYIQRMVESETADRIAILTYGHLVRWYQETFGFQRKGESGTTFGGGEWVDMILDFNDERIKNMNADWDEDEEEEVVEEEVVEEVSLDKS